MQVFETAIPGVKILEPRQYSDSRGVFCETYSRRALSAIGIDVEFVQDNHSISRERNTVRGLHFQIPPFAQDKLIRVSRGSIFDVVVDLRRESATFGKHVATILSADNWRQLFVPAGFAHGLCTLEPGTSVLYKVSQFYSPEHDRGVLWNDPELGIEWPTEASDALLSEKDSRFPKLKDLPGYF